MDPQLQELLDKQAIYEVLARWSRGLDRGDVDLMASVFHDDVVITQGGRHYDGVQDGIVPAADYVARHQRFTRHLHVNTNVLIELDGDVARCETYFAPSLVVNDNGVDRLLQYGGRHLDRMERRNGVWKIAQRLSIFEWRTLTDLYLDDRDGMVDTRMTRVGELGGKSEADPSYHIP
jgi:hypothetical protein